MALTDTAIKAAKPAPGKASKLSDEKGLYLLITPSGGKWWRLDYRFDGKRKTLSMGTYPEVSLKEAREKRDEARKLLTHGVDPSEQRKAVKAAREGAAENSFEVIAREWHENQKAKWTARHAAVTLARLERDVFPWLGVRVISDIEAPDILTVLRRVEARGANELTHSVKRSIGQAFRFAIATGRAKRNPVPDLQGALQPVIVEHLAAITDPKAIGELLRAIDGYTGDFPTLCALKLSTMLMLRPGELRSLEWKEIDFDAAQIVIPGAKMKMRQDHIVPLPRQAVAILEEIKPLTGYGRYVFPSGRTPSGSTQERPMSENTVNGALRRLGYSGDTMTAHGFRAMASTRLNEAHLFHPDAIERQLAHGERDSVRAAYHRAQYLPERVKMMQWWADYLDSLRAGATVLPFKRAG